MMIFFCIIELMSRIIVVMLMISVIVVSELLMLKKYIRTCFDFGCGFSFGEDHC